MTADVQTEQGAASVLVAHATTYGSTREVAQVVAETLGEGGVSVELRAAADVAGVEGHSAVVLGGPLYFFRLHKDARKFLAHHRRSLERLPVAVFVLGPFNDKQEEFDGARQQLGRALAKEPWLKPAAIAVFGGRFDPERLRFPHNNPGMRKLPASDIRDWDEIRRWARSLPVALGLEEPR
jgi:menaquinone-dependent protoporphyrinogen oxidase